MGQLHDSTQTYTLPQGATVRMRYFDTNGLLQAATLTTTSSTQELVQQAGQVKQGLMHWVEGQGGVMLDVSMDIEELTHAFDFGDLSDIEELELPRPRPALRLATSNGHHVLTEPDQIIDLMDATGLPWYGFDDAREAAAELAVV